MQEQILKEQQRTNELLEQLINQYKNPNELLTIEQLHEEIGIGVVTLRKMFNDPELPVQRYTTPFKVTRKALNEYLSVRHDYLCKN